MRFYTDVEDLARKCSNSVVTVGTFDGVHIGHMKVLGCLLRRARTRGAQSVLITFDPHPKAVVDGSAEPFILTTVEEKASIVEQAGVECMLAIKFDKKFASITPMEFISRILVGELKIREMVVGYDHHFGFQRSGDISLLKDEGARLGFGVEVVPPALLEGLPVSSTRIRRVLKDGNVSFAYKMLGRHYSITGEVVKGARRGKRVGYRTANIDVHDARKLLPQDGVYAVTAKVDEKVRQAVMNIGSAPTFKVDGLSLEVHIIDFSDEIYGKEITVDFFAKIRNEVEFKSEKELAEQIARDISESRRILSTKTEV
jgi:riboflavin kinase/FMN adenylyltransferase